MIIETCPECGHDLLDEVICTYPPIPRKYCPSCGWSWTGERDEVMRVPFGGNSYVKPEPILPTTVTLEVNDTVSLNSTGKADSTITTKEYPSTQLIDPAKVAKLYKIGDNLKQIEKLPSGKTSEDGIWWERRPTKYDLCEKVDEIIEVLNELVALHTQSGPIMD